MSKKSRLSNEELIQKIEAIDESVLPDKEEILRRLKGSADSNSDSEANTKFDVKADLDLKANSGINSDAVSFSDNSIGSHSNKNSNGTSKGSNKVLLSVGMFFQFIFTVLGGGMFISGLISGFSVKWDTSVKDGVANISIFLSVFGGIFFLIGIVLTFVMYKMALKGYIRSKLR